MNKYHYFQKRGASGELQQLKIPLRNKVRAIVAAKDKEAFNLINHMRDKCNASELYFAERAIGKLASHERILPELFPETPSITEKYVRLNPLDLKKNLDYLDGAIRHNFEKLSDLIDQIKLINDTILGNSTDNIESLLEDTAKKYGYSHLLLRKAIAIHSFFDTDAKKLPRLHTFIGQYGFAKNPVNSLLYCYKEEQDYLSVKRSVMSTPNLGSYNRFTRDILRIGFHPHAKNGDDLTELIQSALQSSLIDALVITKVNSDHFELPKYPFIQKACELLESKAHPIKDLAEIFKPFNDPEDVFFQRSSAWLESDEVVEYRYLFDHFNDSPDASYFELTDRVVKRSNRLVDSSSIEDILNQGVRVKGLRLFSGSSMIANSAMLNLLIHKTEGKVSIGEDTLIKLMEKTRDLSRTINVSHFKNLALCSTTELTKIICFLLVIKRSKNEGDNFTLRRTLQTHLKNHYESDLTKFVQHVAKKSQTVAQYIYDVCNEDFISKLSHLITSSEQITETRASLHEWAADSTGDNQYRIRARNLRIDHRINLVRNELDDNRIYVDTQKFIDWMQDNIAQDLTTALTLSVHSNEEANPSELQLSSSLTSCYSQFCSHELFGIASYLGRRLRHGTFRGHLYSSFVNDINRNFSDVINDPSIEPLWTLLKKRYEKEVEEIVNEKLHIKSKTKSSGFLDPEIVGLTKLEVKKGCISNIIQDFKSTENSYSALILINEYCWRLAEIDMRTVNNYLKSRKSNLVDQSILKDIKQRCSQSQINEQRMSAFCRQVQKLVNDKLNEMYGWFKKPQSVSPKASLNLLYKAVVDEVQQSFPNFEPDTSFEEDQDIVLMGGAYHVIYDALYVIVYNAAKHGKPEGQITRTIEQGKDKISAYISISFSSEIKDNVCEQDVNRKLEVSDGCTIDDAQVIENRSGIKKLHHLQKYEANFQLVKTNCENRQVNIQMIYRLG
uniref:hypothetical protein n=1 Tax=Vibrio kanaloae TaxID=170673 RepID=UPI0019D01295|nr:hypothetical protein [Vibrio kanaloae]